MINIYDELQKRDIADYSIDMERGDNNTWYNEIDYSLDEEETIY